MTRDNAHRYMVTVYTRGDFATGQRTQPMGIAIGSFATGNKEMVHRFFALDTPEEFVQQWLKHEGDPRD